MGATRPSADRAIRAQRILKHERGFHDNRSERGCMRGVVRECQMRGARVHNYVERIRWRDARGVSVARSGTWSTTVRARCVFRFARLSTLQHRTPTPHTACNNAFIPIGWPSPSPQNDQIALSNIAGGAFALRSRLISSRRSCRLSVLYLFQHHLRTLPQLRMTRIAGRRPMTPPMTRTAHMPIVAVARKLSGGGGGGCGGSGGAFGGCGNVRRW